LLSYQQSFVLRNGRRGKEVLHRPHFVTILKTIEGNTPSIGVNIRADQVSKIRTKIERIVATKKANSYKITPYLL